MRTVQCWQCCGMRRVLDSGDPGACSACGGLLELSEWPINLADSADVTICGTGTFQSIGPIYLHSPRLLTYAVDDEHAKQAIYKKNVVALFAPSDFEYAGDVVIIRSDAPAYDFFKFHNKLVLSTDFYGENQDTIIHETAYVHPTAQVSKYNVRIGANTVVGPYSVIRKNTVIGEQCVITDAVTIGIHGARFCNRPDGSRMFCEHGGGVIIGDRVHIGAQSVIVRSVWNRWTHIGDETFIGNLVNIGHNVYIEGNAMILPCAALLGRSRVYHGATVSLNATVCNDITVGTGAFVSPGAVVTKDVQPNTQVSGNFAIPHDQFIKNLKEACR